MSAPTRLSQTRAQRLGLASALMVLANVPWVVVSYLVGAGAMALVGAEEGHLLSEYGAGGWVAWVLMLTFMAIPSIVGVVLGVRARRLGERTLGNIGIAMNLLIGVGWVALSAAQVVFG